MSGARGHWYLLSFTPISSVFATMYQTYEPIATLSGHKDTVTALEFSPDGRLLASAGEDGVLLIFSTLDWRSVYKFVDASPLSTLLWHPALEGCLFCGLRGGDVHTLRLNGSKVNFFHARLWNAHLHYLVRRVWRYGRTSTTGRFAAWRIILNGTFWLLDAEQPSSLPTTT